MSVKGSCLDDDPGIRPAAHVFVGSKAAWFEITDGLPQLSGGIANAFPIFESSPSSRG